MKNDTSLSIERFVRVLDLAGIDAAARERLHQTFEREDPEAHQAFLAALNASPDAIRRIRAQAA